MAGFTWLMKALMRRSVFRSQWKNQLKDYVESIGPLRGLRLNTAFSDDGKSFWVLKIKVREKIVADGIRDPDFNMEKKGKYVGCGNF